MMVNQTSQVLELGTKVINGAAFIDWIISSTKLNLNQTGRRHYMSKDEYLPAAMKKVCEIKEYLCISCSYYHRMGSNVGKAHASLAHSNYNLSRRCTSN